MNKKFLVCVLALFSVAFLTLGCTEDDIKKYFMYEIDSSTQTTMTIVTVVCNPPYMRFANACCLDQNGNQICDSDEATAD